ncbi:MAG: hypothetical protein PHS82_13180 [Lachnospiraceae bacterium]|nr:hypothetical protein [Lachnospiraceae bacterium]
MTKDNATPKNQMLDSFKNTGTDAVTSWGNNFISTNTPKALDWMVSKIKETVSSLAKSNNMKSRNSIKNIIFQGIEIGERNKENAIIRAMQDVGISSEQITQILETSTQYLVTKEDVEKASIKEKK